MANILIVDDSTMARRNLAIILKQAGHSIIAEAANGIQAFAEYEKHNPDLVTMDITMPVMNGIDSTKKILKSYPNAVIIIVSALNQRSSIFEAIQSGAKHYILKPFTYDKVVEIINEVLKPDGSTKT